MGQSYSPSENYLFLNVMVNFVIVNKKLTGSALHIEKNQTIPGIQSGLDFASVPQDSFVVSPVVLAVKYKIH